jgi:4-hydroxybenzoate polyprenyltransferase
MYNSLIESYIPRARISYSFLLLLFFLKITNIYKPSHFDTSVQALVAALCMNVYVVGLNQLFDIEIDKVFFVLILIMPDVDDITVYTYSEFRITF